MSTHYIYIKCRVPGCTSGGAIYTGTEIVDGFENDSWEGETITATCDDHTNNEEEL
jgi:hypothetical protein